MISATEKVEDAIAPITRSLAEFEAKVVELERSCAGFRHAVKSLSEELRGACARFAPLGAPAEAGVPASRLAQIAGLSSRVEMRRAAGSRASPVLVVAQPGGGVIAVDCRLSYDACLRALGEGAAAPAEGLAAEIRAIIAETSSPSYRGGLGKPVERVVLYVPLEAGRGVLFERLPGIREAAAAAGVSVAQPSELLQILTSVAGAWLKTVCSGSVRALVDRGQDLVDELSAFISFFTENEKSLCEDVEAYARQSRALETGGAPQ